MYSAAKVTAYSATKFFSRGCVLPQTHSLTFSRWYIFDRNKRIKEMETRRNKRDITSFWKTVEKGYSKAIFTTRVLSAPRQYEVESRCTRSMEKEKHG